MGDILGIGVTHYPGLIQPDQQMAGLLDRSRALYFSVDIHAAAREGAGHGAFPRCSQKARQRRKGFGVPGRLEGKVATVTGSGRGMTPSCCINAAWSRMTHSSAILPPQAERRPCRPRSRRSENGAP